VPSGKWYVTWDDTCVQHIACDEDKARIDGRGKDALAREYDRFRTQAEHHFYSCPLVSQVQSPPSSNPNPDRCEGTRRLDCVKEQPSFEPPRGRNRT